MLLCICYQFCAFKNPIFSTHFSLGSEITGLTALSPSELSFFFSFFGSFFLPLSFSPSPFKKNFFLLLCICYQFCTFKNPIFSTHFSLGSEITGLTAVSPFGLSFFLHQIACVSSLTPLYSTQLCEFLCVPDGGEHLRN